MRKKAETEVTSLTNQLNALEQKGWINDSKNCSIPDLAERRELLLAFCTFMQSGTYDSHNTTNSQDVDAFLEGQ